MARFTPTSRHRCCLGKPPAARDRLAALPHRPRRPQIPGQTRLNVTDILGLRTTPDRSEILGARSETRGLAPPEETHQEVGDSGDDDVLETAGIVLSAADTDSRDRF